MLGAFYHFPKITEAIYYELRFSEWELTTGTNVYYLVGDLYFLSVLLGVPSQPKRSLGSLWLIWHAQYLESIEVPGKEVTPAKNIGLEQDDILGHGFSVPGPPNTR